MVKGSNKKEKRAAKIHVHIGKPSQLEYHNSKNSLNQIQYLFVILQLNVLGLDEDNALLQKAISLFDVHWLHL